jgi:molybdopterin molybdotransferase
MALLSLEEALEAILARAAVLPAEEVEVAAATGRIVREPATALVDLPPFPSSAMDGFAVRAIDTPGELRVLRRIAAGSVPAGPLPPSSAAAISTGAVVPDGADAIVPVERAEDRGETVVIAEPATAGRHIRPRGGDVRAGETLVEAGEVIAARHVGALSAVGIARLSCSRRPRVAILATGSELREPGSSLRPGQIYESNRAMLAAVLSQAGAEAMVLPVVKDDKDEHRRGLARGLEADVLVTSGGVSMGEHDLVRTLERDLGVEEVFWGVAIKPGKPLSFGVRGATLVFGLPGNPVSSLVGALVFVRSALLALQGARSPQPAFQPGRLSTAIRRNADRDEFVRARTSLAAGVAELNPVSGQESHMIVRAAAADALVHVPRGDGELSAGDAVRFLSLA